MSASTVPSVTFSNQSTVPAWPNELHECIDMTPELQAWAAEALPAIRARAEDATQAERAALHISNGESSWRRAGGPATARERDNLDHVYALLSMLASGRAISSYYGWIDRNEWRRITSTVHA